LNHHKEGVVDTVVQFLGADLAAEVEADTLGKHLIEFGHCFGLTGLEAVNETGPRFLGGDSRLRGRGKLLQYLVGDWCGGMGRISG